MHRRNLIKSTFALTAVLLFVSLYSVPVHNTEDSETIGKTAVVINIPATAVDANEDKTEIIVTDSAKNMQDKQSEDPKTEYSPEQLELRFISMLNMNYCYGDAFNNPEKMASAAAVTLIDFASDIPGYGICVNKSLISGFAESFYGVQLDCSEISLESSPEGTLATPCTEVGTQYHKTVSVTETDDGYEVLSQVTFYYGGDDVEVRIARSVFAENSSSQFGFNLISCELI